MRFVGMTSPLSWRPRGARTLADDLDLLPGDEGRGGVGLDSHSHDARDRRAGLPREHLPVAGAALEAPDFLQPARGADDEAMDRRPVRELTDNQPDLLDRRRLC